MTRSLWNARKAPGVNAADDALIFSVAKAAIATAVTSTAS